MMPVTEKARRKALPQPLNIAAEERSDAFYWLGHARAARLRCAARDNWTDGADVREYLGYARTCQARAESAGLRLP